MQEPEPEAELQATANLSPVSPSPVHTAAPLVVPALQDTVDTIDAMVAAAVAPNGVADAPETAPETAPEIAPEAAPATRVDGDNDDVVDDESFEDAYRDEAADAPQATDAPQQDQPDTNDDYAKTFDSPIGAEDGEGEGDGEGQQQDVSSIPPQSNDVPLSSDHLSNLPPDAPPVVAASSEAPQPPADVTTAQPEAHSDAPAEQVSHLTEPPQDALSSQPAEPAVEPAGTVADSDHQAVDIQQLMADLTSQRAEPSPNDDPSASTAEAAPPAAPASIPPTALPSSSSLPPRPPLPQTPTQPYGFQNNPPGAAPNAGAPLPSGQPSTFVTGGAPGTSGEVVTNLPPPPATGLSVPPALQSVDAPQLSAQAPGYPAEQPPEDNYQRAWNQFMADERQYMSEAKWDRFPEGSRIFIGNLSSDKVSKRDVFDMFYRFGRLAQISLKSAYGFVQYHTVAEGHSALENLQGVEIKGRRIHLEISRAQDKSKRDRNKSPDRGRGRDGGRRHDKSQGRDDYRPGRNHSPRRNDYNARDSGYGRERGGFFDSGRGRGRSRSPGYGRNDKESYRRRSPSPYGRSRHNSELDLPPRYGPDVPDVQIILQPEVNRDFVAWVEGAFKARSLKTEVMFLHPRFPKDQVIQRQAAEGVHAVVDLDLRAQNLGRVPVQAFDRSGGSSNVRFDQYVDLEPNTAAEVILRAKASGQPSYGQPYGAGATGYGNPYGGQPPHTPQHPMAGAPTPAAYPPQQPQQQQQAQPSVADLASIMGQVDNATLQRLLSSIQAPPQQGAMPVTPAPGPAPPNPQVDIQAILGSLGGNAAPQQHGLPQPQYGAPYGAPDGGGHQVPGQNGDSAAHVQNIMSQLARFRQ